MSGVNRTGSPISSATTFTLLASWVFKIRGCRKNSKNEKSIVYVNISRVYKYRIPVATHIADFPFQLFPTFPSNFPHRPLYSHSSLVFPGHSGDRLLLTHPHTFTVRGGGAWLSVSRRKKTGSRRRNVIKEHLAAEDRKRIRR